MQQTKGIEVNEYQTTLIMIKIGFLRQGMSFSTFCKQNGIDRRNAIRALKKQRNGEKARMLRQCIITASRGKNPITRGETI